MDREMLLGCLVKLILAFLGRPLIVGNNSFWENLLPVCNSDGRELENCTKL